MAEIEMLGGGGVTLDHSTEESPVQHGGGGDIEMYGGSDMHIGHTPVSSAQKRGGASGIDMVGPTDLINPGQKVTPYGSEYPCDEGRPAPGAK